MQLEVVDSHLNYTNLKWKSIWRWCTSNFIL